MYASGMMPTDRDLLAVVDGALADAAGRAGDLMDCRRGCPACCLGPFPINALDVVRLQQGLADLAGRDPARALAVRARARAALDKVRDHFPGDGTTGRLGADPASEEAFCARFAPLPCPALDPGTGLCDLYLGRPLSCRTFGLPVRVDGEDLEACTKCFAGTEADAERCRAVVDPEGLEDALLTALEAEGPCSETVVAYALASGA